MSFKKSFTRLMLICFSILICNHSFSQNQKQTNTRDKLIPLSPASVNIDGYLGEKLDQCIHNRVMIQDVESILNIFRVRQKDNLGYNGEFFGKWATAAALSYRYEPNAALQQKLTNTVSELIKTQSPDGYITTYKKEDEFKVWDIWNQKYVLLGLIAQYDISGNKKTLDAAVKTADYVMSNLGPGKTSLEEFGPAIHKGGVNFSILEPFALLYERTGEKRFLDYATYIVDSWSKPGKRAPNGIRLIEEAQNPAIPLVESEVLHSYTLMSCFEGLCELYRATGKELYLDASVKLANKIKKYELMVGGSLSNHEVWYNGALEQTEMLEMPMETCATATWMKLCYQLLRLTGDSKWADEMEISLYNGLLGAMMPKGEWWAYSSSLIGERVPSWMAGCETSCCVASGPRGLMITPLWAAMYNLDGNPVINLYSPGTSSFKISGGKKVVILQETDYPTNNLISLNIQPEKVSSFALKLRIPEWSKKTVLKVNDEVVACTPGSYATIERTWKKNDKVTLELDLRGRVIRAPSGASQNAIMRGPILLAMDNRLVTEQPVTAWLLPQPYKFDNLLNKGIGYVLPKYSFQPAGEDVYIDLKQVPSPNKDIRMAFEVPFLVRRVQFLGNRMMNIVMCDFASAGNQWNSVNIFRVWLPQPLFMGNGSLFPKETGKVITHITPKPVVPENIKKKVYKE